MVTVTLVNVMMPAKQTWWLLYMQTKMATADQESVFSEAPGWPSVFQVTRWEMTADMISTAISNLVTVKDFRRSCKKDQHATQI